MSSVLCQDSIGKNRLLRLQLVGICFLATDGRHQNIAIDP